MDTPQPKTSGEQGYDGFISYSHAADGLLAPRLQSSLQRFAKPWWKRRALRIFRDESSLSANPHLWSSIADALDESGWFVLLLSPDAAASEWVNQEVSYWVEHRDPARIIPVVTAGEFGWDGDVVGDAVPAALCGVFGDEPRWVDARRLGDPETLDLKNPEFAAVVADLAAPLRGVPKDELASEEVRQHKRTVRSAWTAGVVVLLLAVVATAFGIQSSTNAAEAERQAIRAEQKEADAEASAAVAGKERDNARTAEDAAVRAAANAESRRLRAEALLAMSQDPQLTMLLALEAVSVATDDAVAAEAEGVLREGVIANRLLARFVVPAGPIDWPIPFEVDQSQDFDTGTYVNRGALSPDATVIYHLSRVDNSVRALPADGGADLWRLARPVEEGEVLSVSASPGGQLVAVTVMARAGSPGRVLMLDATSGQVRYELVSPGCPVILPVNRGFSGDGDLFSVHTGDERCVGVERSPDSDWAAVYSTESWEEVVRFVEPGARGERLQLAPEAGTALLAYRDGGTPTFRIVSYPDLTGLVTVSTEARFYPAFAPTGTAVAAAAAEFTLARDDLLDLWGLRLWREESDFDAQLDTGWDFAPVLGYRTQDGFDLDHHVEPAVFSPDGSMLAVGGQGPRQNSSGRSDAVLDAVSGRLVFALGPTPHTFDLSWSADGSTLLSVHENELRLWAVVPDPARLNPVIASRDWAGFALSDVLVRGLSVTECETYAISDPCPGTVEAVKARYTTG